MHWAINDVAWVGDAYVSGSITGVVLDFHGLGATGLKTGPTEMEQALAARGALTVYPYYGPWSWMNEQARTFVDGLIDEIYRVYQLTPETPLLIQGGSMGGHSALLFTRYTRHPVAACATNCPVCDTAYHFTERPDLPRTMYHAFGYFADDFSAVLEANSPLHQVAALPDIPYLIIHGDADTAVNKAQHSDKMVPAMRARWLDVEYLEVPGMGHCGPLPVDIFVRYRDFLLEKLAAPVWEGRQ